MPIREKQRSWSSKQRSSSKRDIVLLKVRDSKALSIFSFDTCLKVLKEACEQTRLNSAMLPCVRRFGNELESLLDHIETIDQRKTNERLQLEMFRKNGELDQVREVP